MKFEADANFGQLRLIGRISLWFGAVALVALLALAMMGGSDGSNYFESVSRLSATRQQLPVLMAVGGLLLAIGTALTTWLIALYSSFRVAGPLHRFCIDLEEGIRTGQVPRVRIRQSDFVQDEARLLEQSVAELYRHHDELQQALEEAVRRGPRAAGARDEGHGSYDCIRGLAAKVRV